MNLFRPVAINTLLAWEYFESGVAYNPASKSVQQNPYDIYEKLRSKDPVHRMRLLDAWTLVSFEDVDAILRDQRRFVCHGRGGSYTDVETLLDFDQPQHTRIRSLVSKAFSARALAELEPFVQQTVAELIDQIGKREKFDLIDSIAYPLPVLVIAKMLGVPARDIDRFRFWSDMVALEVEPLLTNENVFRVRQNMSELLKYFEERINEHKLTPQKDILTTLIKAEEDGDKLSHEELLGTLVLLLVAGNETTRNLIGNGVLALLQHPDQLQWLRNNLDKIDSAVRELLRYDSPVQINSRIASEDVEIRGKKIRAGMKVILLIGAANRDPKVFSNPDQLDFSKTRKAHLAFGRGIHYCLGSVLATMEARIVIEALLSRFPRLNLASEPVRRERVVLRGLKELWVNTT